MLERALGFMRRIPLDVWLLLAILLAGALLRFWLGTLWRPAFLGYPDSGAYLASSRTPFTDQMRPEGYPLFVSLIWKLSPHVYSVVLIQHAMALATAVLAYLMTWWFGAPRWAGLIPAAVIALNGAELMSEHAILSEGLFIFLIIAALTSCAFATSRDFDNAWMRPALAALAGVLLGASVTVRATGIFLLPLIAIFLAIGAGRTRGAIAAAASIAACLVVMLSMMAWHDQSEGSFAMTKTQYYNYYGRVGTFADCTKFTPPAGTRFLCSDLPPSQRQGHEYWVFAPKAPLVKAWGDGYISKAPPEGAERVRAFALAAIIHQPGDYLSAVVRDAIRLFDPAFKRNPNPAIGNTAAGMGPEQLRKVYTEFNFSNLALYQQTGRTFDKYGVRGSLAGIYKYESVFRFTGLRLALLLMLAFAAPFLVAPGRERRGAILLATSGAALIFMPILIAKYDFRFTIPAYGVLAAAAAMTIAALTERLRSREPRRQRAPSDQSPDLYEGSPAAQH